MRWHAFLYQQAAEKLVKAVLFLHGERRVLGHSVLALVRRAAEYRTELVKRSEAAMDLDVFYIPTRYPNGVPEGAPFEYFGETHSRRAADAFAGISAAVDPLFVELLRPGEQLPDRRPRLHEPPLPRLVGSLGTVLGRIPWEESRVFLRRVRTGLSSPTPVPVSADLERELLTCERGHRSSTYAVRSIPPLRGSAATSLGRVHDSSETWNSVRYVSGRCNTYTRGASRKRQSAMVRLTNGSNSD